MSEQLQLALPVGIILRDGDNEYEIIDPKNGKGFLGQGGFGITYLAREKRLDRDVAIKEFFPNAIAGRGQTSTVASSDVEQYNALKRHFLNEARILAGFDNPRIVGVLAYFEANNTAYMVMPYLRGPKLSERIRKQKYSEDEAERFFRDLISGLKVVHSAGFLHRDIKPDNIVLEESIGTPILIDFGAAREVKVDGTVSTFGAYSDGFSAKEAKFPETRKTPAMDIYSLGATIYRCMFGNGPKDAGVRDHEKDETGVDSLLELDEALSQGKISPEFSVVLKKCLELRAKDRFQTLDELEAALLKSPKPVPPVPSRRWAYAVAASLIAGMIGAGVWYSGLDDVDSASIAEGPQEDEAGRPTEAALLVTESSYSLLLKALTTPEDQSGFELVIDRFPTSPEAVLAQEFLDKM